VDIAGVEPIEQPAIVRHRGTIWTVDRRNGIDGEVVQVS
jgi:hypothetical protein